MDAERLYRRTIPGILFLGVLFLFYLLKGGDVKLIANLFQKESFSFLIAILITTPVLGLIISTIALGILHIIVGYRFYLDKPVPRIYDIVLRRNDSLKDELKKNKNSKRVYKEFYCKYQSYMRVKLNAETLNFSSRRWNFLWIHLNNITAILLGIFLSCFLEYSSIKNNYYKRPFIAIVVLIVIYLFFAVYQILFIRNESILVEREAVIKSDSTI